jgi:plastocyanin
LILASRFSIHHNHLNQTAFTMKKMLLFFAAATMIASVASATIITVNVAEFSFSPSSIPNAHVGDTIKWVWVNGTHTTTSGAIPTGATAWDAPIDATNTTYSYKLTKAGAYTYHCTPHQSMGMTASITVQGSSGVSAVSTPSLFDVYPNPAANSLYIMLKDGQHATISVIDALGRLVQTGDYSGKMIDIATDAMAAGLYQVRVVVNGAVSIRAVQITH